MSATPLRLASWNVNSIRVRLDAVLAWLEQSETDILCLQETKVADEAFPSDAFHSLGYEVASFGQKGYNGVAIVARAPLRDPTRGFGDETLDAEGARLLGVTVRGLHVYSAYIPNGKVVGSPAYALKLQWLARLRALLDHRHDPAARYAVCGDFNVAAEERDVHDPLFWRAQVLFHPAAREALRQLCEPNLVDTFRLHHQEAGQYSWWDYRQGALAKNEGLRIDYVLASRPLAARCTDAGIDREPRRAANPSDHTPVHATFALDEEESS
jgi:exodeoxyribonuclease III